MGFEQFFEHEIARAVDEAMLAKPLEELLSGGFSIWRDGRLYCIRELVDRIDGLRIEIRFREHGIPHFHVRGGDIDASFAIKDCRLLAGELGHRQVSLIRWWYERSRNKLVEIWNRTRPTDCPVGPIRE